MKLSQFRFKMPVECLALEPPHKVFENEDGTVDKVYRRDECRMMVIHRKSETIDMYAKDAEGKDTDQFLLFRDIINYFDDGDVMVLNDSKVFPARLFGTKEKTDAKIEVFLLRELNEDLRLWDVLVEPARKIRIGNKLFFEEDGPSAPLPRYIINQRDVMPEDAENFQTIYAKNEGAVTAPAAGLHFSRELMKRLEIRGVNFSFLTVHCGLGTFDTIEVEDLTKHKMSSEQMIINAEACQVVNKARKEGHHICVVGVSALRACETAVGTDGMLKEFEGWTNRFIFPPYDFGLADSMVANFYHPESTMLMATAAFGGYDLVMKAYDLAVEKGYKFGCYGDAMLILDD